MTRDCVNGWDHCTGPDLVGYSCYGCLKIEKVRELKNTRQNQRDPDL